MNQENDARNIFNVLDEDKKGYITVDIFKAAFYNFNKDNLNDKEIEENLAKMIYKMNPSKNGEINFENFLLMFNSTNITKHNNSNSEPKSKYPPQYSLKRFLSTEYSDESLDLDDNVEEGMDGGKGYEYSYDPHEDDCDDCDQNEDRNTISSTHDKHMLSRYHIGSDSTAYNSNKRKFSLHDPSLLFPSAVSRARVISSARASPRGSEPHSDVVSEDVNNNFMNVKMQLKRLEEKLSMFQTDQFELESKDAKQLKEENQSLLRRINTLEDSIRDLEERFDRRYDEEKSDSKHRMTKLEDEKKRELETLQNRFYKLEAESAEITLEVIHFRDECERLKSDQRLLRDELSKSDVQLSNLQLNFDKLRTRSHGDIEDIRLDKRKYQNKLIALSASSSTINTSTDAILSHTSATEINSRQRELEDLLKNLKVEGEELSSQLRELTRHMLDKSIEYGSNLLRNNSELFHELDMKSKEELIDVLNKEKDANIKLREYIENVIVKVMERHPALLEV